MLNQRHSVLRRLLLQLGTSNVWRAGEAPRHEKLSPAAHPTRPRAPNQSPSTASASNQGTQKSSVWKPI
jgi:hypothetical protein